MGGRGARIGEESRIRTGVVTAAAQAQETYLSFSGESSMSTGIHAFFNSHEDNWSALPASHRNTVRVYTGGQYTDINYAARQLTNGQIPSSATNFNRVKRLDKAFENPASRLKENTMLYRGMYLNTNDYNNLAVGSTFLEKGFVSTSVRSGFGGNIELVIRAKKGARAIAVGPHSNYPTENEVMLPRATRYRITKIDEVPENYGTGTKKKVYVDLL